MKMGKKNCKKPDPILNFVFGARTGTNKWGSPLWLAKCIHCPAETIKSSKHARENPDANCISCQGRKKIQMVGRRFDKLLVVKQVDNGKSPQSKYLCDCDCGGTVVKTGDYLRRKDHQNCGCENLSITHGMSSDPLFLTFKSMHNRCQTHPKYVNIFVCEEWALDEEGFLTWKTHMGPKPEGYSIEREDNNCPYAPWNCSWESCKTQARNRSSSRYLKSLTTGHIDAGVYWSKELGIPISTFWRHFLAGKYTDLIEVNYQEALEYRQSRQLLPS